ncbi:ABC transporter substrate-binding protein [Methanogenium cariaci]|uniref:ABC transporter substrate-binding protein n=1 Tax=Methanogenium cariaci TaxID=2197 RepID=UPI001FE23569|nr:ABC transporter substrate-binding protein [Methanogenium cariaci]
MIGREVEIPASVNSVVPIAQGSTRVFSYLGATDLIAGISNTENKSFSKYAYLAAHPELKALPPIVDAGGAGDPYFEEILKISPPDLIVASYIDVKNADHIQEKIGIPVVVIQPGVGRIGFMDYNDDTNDLYTSLDLIASIIGKEERAAELKSYIKGILGDLNERTSDISDDEKVPVYVGGAFQNREPLVFHQHRSSIRRLYGQMPIMLHQELNQYQIPWRSAKNRSSTGTLPYYLLIS